MRSGYFISGIGTEVGKTVVSAVLTQAWKADYWKPVQSGDLHYSDSDKVRSWISNDRTVIHSEGFRLQTPASPHYSARLDGVEIRVQDFQLPQTDNTLVVEGAGGLLVPLNNRETILDLMAALKLPVILVSRNYLGSINHTMLSIEAIRARGLELAGLIFTGASNPESESIIAELSKAPVLARIPLLHSVDRQTVSKAAQDLTLQP